MFIRRSCWILLVIIVFVWGPGLEVQAQESPLTLESAIEMAYKSNPDLRKAEFQLDKAQYVRDELAKNISLPNPNGVLMVYPAMQQAVNSFQQAEVNLRTAKKMTEAEQQKLEKDVTVAYSNCIKSKAQLELAKKNLAQMQQLDRIASLSRANGLMSDFEREKSHSSRKQLEEKIKGAEVQYAKSMAELASLLGKGSDWQANLVSYPVIRDYQRNELWMELGRGVSESVLTLAAKNQLDVEKTKEYFPITHTDAYMWNLQYNLAELDYEQANRDARNTIEKLYYQIDSLEKLVTTSELKLIQADKDLELAQLKYEVGMISRYSLLNSSLSGAEIDRENALSELQGYQNDLIQAKAQYAYLTGQPVYHDADWSVRECE